MADQPTAAAAERTSLDLSCATCGYLNRSWRDGRCLRCGAALWSPGMCSGACAGCWLTTPAGCRPTAPPGLTVAAGRRCPTAPSPGLTAARPPAPRT